MIYVKSILKDKCENLKIQQRINIVQIIVFVVIFFSITIVEAQQKDTLYV